ncbi:MAG: amidohydrolase family protein [bacterium]|nr:amidohydrolase family protein [bacterium]
MRFTSSRARAVAAVVPLLFLAPAAGAQSAAPRPEAYALTNVRLSPEEDEPTHTILLEAGRIRAVQFASEQVPAHMRVIDAEGLLAVPAFVDAYGSAGCATPNPTAQKDAPASESANVPIDMRQANRKGIQPAFRAADVYTVEGDVGERFRKNGFGAHVAAPRGELLAGRSALASTRDAAPRDVIIVGDLLHHGAFTASGSGYPSTLMGYHAQLRQFFLDAQRHAELERRWKEGRPGPRPPFDADLQAAQELMAGERRLVCEARTDRDVRRWVALADEFGIQIAISGGREIQKAAALLVERDIPVFLTLDWGEEVKDPREEEKKKREKNEEREPGEEQEAEPDDEAAADEEADVPEGNPEDNPEGNPEGNPEDNPEDPEDPEDADSEEGQEPKEEPKDEPAEEEAAQEGEEAPEDNKDRWKYVEPMPVRIEKRLAWERRRDCALRLSEAGVRVVFGTGTRNPDDVLKSLRALVEAGFSKEAALAGLTSAPAEVLGVDRHFGWLKPGHSAQVALWTKHPLDEGAQVKWIFVDGFPYEFEVKDEAQGEGPADGVDVSGTWDAQDPDDDEGRKLVLELEMAEDGKVSGSAEVESPADGSMLKSDVTGKVSGETVTLKMSIAVGEMQIDLDFEGKVDDDEMKGELMIKFAGQEQEAQLVAERRPGGAR